MNKFIFNTQHIVYTLLEEVDSEVYNRTAIITLSTGDARTFRASTFESLAIMGEGKDVLYRTIKNHLHI